MFWSLVPPDLCAQTWPTKQTILVLPLDLTFGDYRVGDKVNFRDIRAHCTIGLGNHSTFALACNFTHLAPVDSRSPHQLPWATIIEEPTSEETYRLQRILKLASRAFPTPYRGTTAVRGPSQHL